ncbi:MAG: helix-turn-helix transcriptional regulator [Streptococcaceae bacterium]|nr:helix-turn-helix transcriptional regulator [Streptococcaceae bacterium]
MFKNGLAIIIVKLNQIVNKRDKLMWEKIQQILNEKNMTVYQLQVKTGLNTGNLYALKNGRLKNPTFKTMVKVADALGVSLDEFR